MRSPLNNHLEKLKLEYSLFLIKIMDVLKNELLRLGISVDGKTGKIYQNGELLNPVVHKTRKGYEYLKINLYDPLVWKRTRTHGNRNILAARIVWAYIHGICQAREIIKFKDGDRFNLNPDNLYLIKRRK